MEGIGKKLLWLTLPLAVLAAACTIAPSAHGAGGVTVTTDFDNAYINVSRPGERHLEIEVFAPEGHPRKPVRRPPLNIALVIDKSGSMADEGKMEYVREAACRMVDRLRTGDRFSIVAYDSDVRVLLRSESFEDRRRAKRLINGLFPGGSTNLGGGLLEGYRQVRRYFSEGGINRVLILSDGLANRGITDPRELSRIVEREGRRGISLATFGVGLDFNEDLLASMAESGRGTYYYIDRPHRIPEILAREFSIIERVVALNVTVTIEVGPGMFIRDVMGYDYRRDGDRYHVSLGDLAAGERRRIIARFDAPSFGPGEHRIGKVRMSYQRQGDGGSLSTSRELRMHYVRDQAAVDRNMNREVTGRSEIFEANAARQKAAAMVDGGDLDGARAVLMESRRRLERSPVQSPEVRAELEETDDYRAAIEEPMPPHEKKAVQKGIKYRSYKVLQSK